MAVYSKSGSELNAVYGLAGAQLEQAYDVNGFPLLDEIGPVTPRDWSGMTDNFRNNVNDAVAMVQILRGDKDYVYAFPVFTDVHLYFNWNEPNYVAYHWPSLFREYLMLGDIANAYDAGQLNNAVDYMRGAEYQKLLIAMGNHEWGGYDTAGTDPYPREWYKPIIASGSSFFADDGLTYYWDDAVNNVRFIVLDSNSSVKRSAGTQKFNMDALNWMAGVMEDAGDLDIIILDHAMGGGFYLVTDTEQTTWKSDTTITNSGSFERIVKAFVSKGTVSVASDGLTHFYDFSQNGGDFIAYITGHYHNAGHYDGLGFHKFTCPALIRNKNVGRGMSFFVIDTRAKTIRFIVARISEFDHIECYEYSYGTE